MFPLLEENHKPILALIDLARKLYIDPDYDTERSAISCCEHALRLLQKHERNFTTSLHECEAKITLCAAILQEMRLMHVELDPLNSSADLFTPTASREKFVPKPVEKLRVDSSRAMLNRLRETHAESCHIWRMDIASHYSSLTSLQKRAAVDVTTRLASMALLISHPFEALELFASLYRWTKCTPCLRWLTTMLVGLGFPSTAARLIEASPATTILEKLRAEKSEDKYGTQSLMQQVVRVANIITKEIDDGQPRELEENKKHIAGSYQYRLDTVTFLVDSVSNLRPGSSSSVQAEPASLCLSRARQYACHVFAHANRMENCATIPSLEDTQNFLDTFWYLQLLLNDGLMQQRIGNLELAASLFKEGHAVAFVLWCPYWLLRFSTQMVQLQLLCGLYDSSTMAQLAFIRDVICSNGANNGNKSRMVEKVTNSAVFASGDNGTIRKEGCFQFDNTTIELARRASECAEGDRSELKKCGGESDRIIGSAPANMAPMSLPSHTNFMQTYAAIFQSVFSSVSSGDDQHDHTANMGAWPLLKRLSNSSTSRSLVVYSDTVELDTDELTAFVNEPFWNLLDFCLLSSSSASGMVNLRDEDAAIVETAISTFPLTNASIFALYYRLYFSASLAVCKLTQRMQLDSTADVIGQMSMLKLSENDGRARRATGRSKKVGNTEKAYKQTMKRICEDVRQYGHTHYIPWYRLATRLVGLDYLLNNTSSRTKATPAVANFIESSAVSFRHSVLTKDVSSDCRVTQLCRLADDKSLSEALAELPSDWTVVSLHLLEMSTCRKLILCRLSGRCQPIIADLGDVVDKFDAVNEFIAFTKDIDASVKETDKKAYWKKRYALEKSLQEIVKKLESEWFGYRRALLCGFPVRHEWTSSKLASTLDCYSREILLTANAAGLDDNEKRRYISDMLNARGSKLDKLLNIASTISQSSSDTEPVFLILDQGLHCIPWENTPVLRDQPVCRVPCLQFLLRMVQSSKLPRTISRDRVFYVVNPSGDLAVAEDYLKWFRDMERWNGIFGTQPELVTMKESLASNDIYIYCGHNSGVPCLYSTKKIEQLSCKAAVLLMGCGSCKMVSLGHAFETRSIASSYLLAQSPCVVGCLWSVTSPDIDRYLVELLKHWLDVGPSTQSSSSSTGPNSELSSLLRAVVKARWACKLPYLTGAAVVSFGLPIYYDGRHCNEDDS